MSGDLSSSPAEIILGGPATSGGGGTPENPLFKYTSIFYAPDFEQTTLVFGTANIINFLGDNQRGSTEFDWLEAMQNGSSIYLSVEGGGTMDNPATTIGFSVGWASSLNLEFDRFGYVANLSSFTFKINAEISISEVSAGVVDLVTFGELKVSGNGPTLKYQTVVDQMLRFVEPGVPLVNLAGLQILAASINVAGANLPTLDRYKTEIWAGRP